MISCCLSVDNIIYFFLSHEILDQQQAWNVDRLLRVRYVGRDLLRQGTALDARVEEHRWSLLVGIHERRVCNLFVFEHAVHQDFGAGRVGKGDIRVITCRKELKFGGAKLPQMVLQCHVIALLARTEVKCKHISRWLLLDEFIPCLLFGLCECLSGAYKSYEVHTEIALPSFFFRLV